MLTKLASATEVGGGGGVTYSLQFVPMCIGSVELRVMFERH